MPHDGSLLPCASKVLNISLHAVAPPPPAAALKCLRGHFPLNTRPLCHPPCHPLPPPISPYLSPHLPIYIHLSFTFAHPLSMSVKEFLCFFIFVYFIEGTRVLLPLLKFFLSLRVFIFSFRKRFMFTISPSLIFPPPFELYKRRLLWSGNNLWPDMQFAS